MCKINKLKEMEIFRWIIRYKIFNKLLLSLYYRILLFLKVVYIEMGDCLEKIIVFFK